MNEMILEMDEFMNIIKHLPNPQDEYYKRGHPTDYVISLPPKMWTEVAEEFKNEVVFPKYLENGLRQLRFRVNYRKRAVPFWEVVDTKIIIEPVKKFKENG